MNLYRYQSVRTSVDDGKIRQSMRLHCEYDEIKFDGTLDIYVYRRIDGCIIRTTRVGNLQLARTVEVLSVKNIAPPIHLER